MKRKLLLDVLGLVVCCMTCGSCLGLTMGLDLVEDMVRGSSSETSSTDPIYGSWSVDKVRYKGDLEYSDFKPHDESIFIYDTGLFESNGYFGIFNGSFRYNKNSREILVTIYERAAISISEIEVKDNVLSMCITFTLTGNSVWVKCSRATNAIVPSGIYDTLLGDSAVDFIDSYYRQVRDFSEKQKEVETILLQKNHTLTPYADEVYDLWKKGYRFVSNANTAIDGAQGIIFSGALFERNFLVDHLIALKLFVLYNMNQLWGGVPLSMDAGTNPVRMGEREVYDYIIKGLSTLQFPAAQWDHGSLFYNSAVFNLLAECYLSIGYYELATTCANDAGKEDYISYLFAFRDDDYPYYPYRTSDYNSIYCWNKLSLYKAEASRDLEGLEEAWDKDFLLSYGYWAAMKRLGLAASKANCNEKRLLLPIPQSEIDRYSNLKQNPGY